MIHLHYGTYTNNAKPENCLNTLRASSKYSGWQNIWLFFFLQYMAYAVMYGVQLVPARRRRSFVP